MSLHIPSQSEKLYSEACQLLSNTNPIQTDWNFVGFNTTSASVNIGIGAGGSTGCLTVQKNGAPQPVNVNTYSADLSVGITPVPFNFGFPIPRTPGKGVIYKFPSFVHMQLNANSFRGLFYSFTPAIQCGPTIAVTYTLIIPKMVPNLSIYSPGIILTAGVLIVNASMNGALVPDIGLSASLGIGL